MLRLATGLLALMLLAVPAAADELSEKVRSLYKPYEVEGGTTPDVTSVLKPIATKRLRDLLAKDDACAKKNGVCNLGHDPIISGQDYKIEKVQVSAADIQGDKASVTARYLNFGGQHENKYEFAKEGGAWKLADIVAVLPKETRGRLTEDLAPTKKKRR